MSKELEDADTHGGGCFSCRWGKRRKDRQLDAQAADKNGEGGAIPSTGEYALEATKKTLEVLRGAAGLIPIPLVKEVLEIGLYALSMCETINEVQEKVNLLKNRIAEFLLVIAKVAKNDWDESPTAVLSRELLEELEELKNCLVKITAQLDKIKDQNGLLTALLPQVNMATIDECITAFQDSIDRFRTLRGIHAAQDLRKIQAQVEEMYGLTQKVLRKVDRIEGRVDEVKSAVNELKALMDHNATSMSFTAAGVMPLLPKNFFGRTTIVDSIAKQLTASTGHSTPRICILGPGGQGKTSTALAVMNHPEVKTRFTTQHQYWIPCIGANSPATFLAILAKHLRASSQNEDLLQAIFATLSETEDPRLILLDNFETPWHPVEGTQQSIVHILTALDTLTHVNILVTMRSEFPPLDHWTSEKLSSLELEDARKIYMAIDKEAIQSPELDELLAALGYLPYAITLMATRGKRSLSSPAELLAEWKKSGTDMLSKAEEGMDYSIQLSINSKFVTDSPGALHLLQVLSMLPAGVLRNDLPIWIKSWESEALDTLREAALVRTSEVEVRGARRVHIFVLPVVQSYMQRQGRIPGPVRKEVHNACCVFLAKKSSCSVGPSDANFRPDVAAIAAQETNIQALLTTILSDAKALNASSPDTASPSPINLDILPYDANEETTIIEAGFIFSGYQFWTKPRFEVAEQVICLAQSANDSWREAETRFCLGHAFWRLSCLREAAEQLDKAKEIYVALSKLPRGIRAEFMALTCRAQIPDFEFATTMATAEKAFADWAQYADDDKEVGGWYFHYKSQFALLFMRKPEQAAQDAATSERLFKDVGLSYEAYLSEYIRARACAALGEFEKCLEILHGSIMNSVDESYGSLGIMQDLAPAYLFKATALKALGRWDDSQLLENLMAAFTAYQEAGHLVDTGQCLMQLGEVYVRNKDWPAARLAYEEAVRKCGKSTDFTAQYVIRHCQHNLRYIENREAGTRLDEDIVFQEPVRA